MAEIAQRNVHAEIPGSEIEKITSAVEEKVKSTACNLPETNELAQQIADRVLNRVNDTIATSVEETVRRTPIKLEHLHIHSTTRALSQYAEESTKKWLLILTIACGLLLSICIGGTYWFLNSEYYLGREYAELCYSKYATESEKDKLRDNITVISLLSKDYRKNPERVKTVIRQYKSTLDERKKQAAKNKGTYRNNPAIER